MMPKNHVLKVKHGSVGSSVIGTVSRTCSIGQSFTSSVNQNIIIIIIRTTQSYIKKLSNIFDIKLYQILDVVFVYDFLEDPCLATETYYMFMKLL